MCFFVIEVFACFVCALSCDVAWFIVVCVVVCSCARVRLDAFVYFVCEFLCDVA